MSRWLIAMSGTVGGTATGEHEVKTQNQEINNLSEQLGKNNEVIEDKKSFNRKEDNPEGRDISNVPIGISPNGQQQTKDAIA